MLGKMIPIFKKSFCITFFGSIPDVYPEVCKSIMNDFRDKKNSPPPFHFRRPKPELGKKSTKPNHCERLCYSVLYILMHTPATYKFEKDKFYS